MIVRDEHRKMPKLRVAISFFAVLIATDLLFYGNQGIRDLQITLTQYVEFWIGLIVVVWLIPMGIRAINGFVGRYQHAPKIRIILTVPFVLGEAVLAYFYLSLYLVLMEWAVGFVLVIWLIPELILRGVKRINNWQAKQDSFSKARMAEKGVYAYLLVLSCIIGLLGVYFDSPTLLGFPIFYLLFYVVLFYMKKRGYIDEANHLTFDKGLTKKEIAVKHAGYYILFRIASVILFLIAISFFLSGFYPNTGRYVDNSFEIGFFALILWVLGTYEKRIYKAPLPLPNKNGIVEAEPAEKKGHSEKHAGQPRTIPNPHFGEMSAEANREWTKATSEHANDWMKEEK